MKPKPCIGLSQHCIEDFARILQRCGKDRNRTQALNIYVYMRRNGLDTHPILGNYLIPMLVDVGENLHRAQLAFDRFLYPNEWSWNVLINGYITCGKPIHALHLYNLMKKDDCSRTHPSGHTYVAALKACAMLKDVKKGEEIHGNIVEIGLLTNNVFVANSLIDMYAKCGSMVKARKVFDVLFAKNAVSYNAMITGYTENGLGEEAIKCFESMRNDGVSPNSVTFISTLKSCGIIKDSSKGQAIHAEAESKGLLERGFLLGTVVVDMYAKCGLLEKAWNVFEKLLIRDVVSWTALIAGYVEGGHGRQAIECFEQMLLEGVSPNSITYASCLKACSSIGDIEKAIEIHGEIDKKGIRDLLLETTLVDVYCKCGALVKARKVFDKLRVRDIICWNALISGYVEHGYEEKALKCLEQMHAEGISPDAVTFICGLKACTSTRDVDKGQKIHDDIERQGLLGKNLVIGNALIDMYAKCNSLAKARKVFDEIPNRDVVSWTSLMSGYVEHGHGEEAIDCYEEMQVAGIHPNAVTFVCCLKACGSVGATEKGCEIHKEIERHGLIERDPVVGTTLVDMYSKCGALSKAREVFEKLPVRDGVSWTALMAGYAQIGKSEHVFDVYDRMLGEGMKPNLVTFVILLNACSRACLFNKSQTYFEAMNEDYGIVPTLEHHTCMIHLLGRVGNLDEALALIKEMPFFPDPIVWHSILGSCRQSGNSGIAKEVFKRSLHI